MGAQKCGTTALHRYLKAHPEISASKKKELNFFLTEENFARGIPWYREQFDGRMPVRVESSPNYTATPVFPGVMARIASVVPDARFVYLVRDPVERMASHWVHNEARGRHRAHESLASTLCSNPDSTYLARSRYALQLTEFLRYFAREQVLVLDQRDLLEHRAETLARIFAFAGVDPDFTHRRFAREFHRSDQKQRESDADGQAPTSPIPIVRPDVRAALPPEVLEVLRADAREFAALSGLDVGRWPTMS